MPTRYLKPGICDSDTLNRIKHPESEILYYRLLVTVDDFGRFDARPAVIKGRCFPLKQSATEKSVNSWLSDLESAGAIVLYEAGNRRYLQITKWDNTPRAKASKFPQMQTDVCSLHTLLPVTVTVTETETTTLSGKPDPVPINGRNYKAESREVLDYLNRRTGSSYRPVEANLDLILARLKSGVTATKMKEVVLHKADQWQGDAKMAEYLRPKTLFNRTNFEQYLGEINDTPAN